MHLPIKTSLVVIAGVLAALSGCSSDDDNNNPMSSGAPSISRVSWTQVAGCTAGTASDVTISVTVRDSDNDLNDLTFSGFVSNCTGSIDGLTSTVTCPQLAQYNGSVTVTDPDNNADSITFSFGPCQDGVVTK
ncbi:MAG: hypothetical protein ACE5IR_25050 [bacterium]